jgi:hypothetical protein
MIGQMRFRLVKVAYPWLFKMEIFKGGRFPIREVSCHTQTQVLVEEHQGKYKYLHFPIKHNKNKIIKKMIVIMCAIVILLIIIIVIWAGK